MAGSIFKAKKHTITDDPLQFLFNWFLHEFVDYTFYIKWVISLIALYVQIFNVICFVDVYINKDWTKLQKYLPVIIIQQPGSIGFLVGISSVREFFNFREVVFHYCWSINSAGRTIQARILKDCKQLKLFCFVVFLLTLFAHATFLPVVGDESSIIYPVMITKKYFGNFASLVCCIYYVCFLCLAYGYILVVLIFFYVALHLKFQFYLINEHLQSLSRDYNYQSEISFEDDNYQEIVYKRLVLCTRQHVNLKVVAELFSHITKLPIAATTLTSSSVFAATAFFVLSDVSPQSNFRMYLMSMLCLMTLVTLCTCGEMLVEESDQLYYSCINSPWTLWNKKNKHALLMLMIGCSRPLKLTFYNLLDLNYSFILYVLRITYRLQALLLKYK